MAIPEEAQLSVNLNLSVRWFIKSGFHNENTPIQIYWKFHHQKLKIFR